MFVQVRAGDLVLLRWIDRGLDWIDPSHMLLVSLPLLGLTWHVWGALHVLGLDLEEASESLSDAS